MAVLAYTNPGDKIVIQTPVYPPFFDAVRQNNRTLVENPLKVNEGRFVIDFDDLDQKDSSGAGPLSCATRTTPWAACSRRMSCATLGEVR